MSGLASMRCRWALRVPCGLRLAAVLLLAFGMDPAAVAGEPAAPAVALPAIPAPYQRLDSADLLKGYFFADAKVAPVAAEFTRYQGDVDAAERGAANRVQAAMAAARKSAFVVLDLPDIGLHRYDGNTYAFPMDNRLFVPGMSYYFDNSPYHFVYTNPQGLNPFPCRDPLLVERIDQAVARYETFRIRVYGQVMGADAGDHAVSVRLIKVQLLDKAGQVLLTHDVGA